MHIICVILCFNDFSREHVAAILPPTSEFTRNRAGTLILPPVTAVVQSRTRGVEKWKGREAKEQKFEAKETEEKKKEEIIKTSE